MDFFWKKIGNIKYGEKNRNILEIKSWICRLKEVIFYIIFHYIILYFNLNYSEIMDLTVDRIIGMMILFYYFCYFWFSYKWNCEKNSLKLFLIYLKWNFLIC